MIIFISDYRVTCLFRIDASLMVELQQILLLLVLMSYIPVDEIWRMHVPDVLRLLLTFISENLSINVTSFVCLIIMMF